MTWRSSSYSGTDGNCVQVRRTLDTIRDSKNPAGPTLGANVSQLLAAVRSDRLTR